MFSRTAFISGRTPPVPAFPKSATAGEKKEENKNTENEPLPHSPSPVPPGASRSQSPIPRLRDMITEDSSNGSGENASARPVGIIAEAASSRHARIEARFRQLAEIRQLIEKEDLNQARKISSVAAEEARYAEMVRKSAVQEATDADRESLCIEVGKVVGGDRTEVTIWPMLDIEHSDQAMIIRVRDLLGPSFGDHDVVLGGPFIAEHEQGMAIVDDESLCGILVTTVQSYRGQVRVADLTNFKKRRERGFKGYDEIDINFKKPWNSHVIIVKHGQNAIIQGRPMLRLFVRVAPGTAKELAMRACENAWSSRATGYQVPPVWHDYFTKNQEAKTT